MKTKLIGVVIYKLRSPEYMTGGWHRNEWALLKSSRH